MNIAFFCIPAHGHTNPTLAVVRELTARGHTVRYYTTEAFRAKVEAAGAVFVPFDAEAARPGMTAADGARLGSDLTPPSSSSTSRSPPTTGSAAS